MKITFTIDYRTQFGQNIYVGGSAPELGNWDVDKAVRLNPAAGSTWEAELKIKTSSLKNFSYKYFVKDDYNPFLAWEMGAPRLLKVNKRFAEIQCRDNWRAADNNENSLYTSPFYRSIFNREDAKSYKPEYSEKQKYIRLQVRAPRVGKEYSLGLIGSCKTLGAWNEKKVVLMNDEDFPVWKVDLPFKPSELPFEYKYVIYSDKEKKIVTWEANDNRYFARFLLKDPAKLIVHTDEDVVNPVGNWKAAGVAIPVRSLRSAKGVGVGEFVDIKKLVDWAVISGMKVIQVLPVNDTIATHTWVDSYPYAAISVNALHPIFGNMSGIGKLKDKKAQKELDDTGKKLNSLSEIDYEGVMKLKSRYYKLSFDEKKDKVLSSKAFLRFFETNQYWLEPYAAFSYLRDKYKTADFNQWGKYQKISRDGISKLVDPQTKHYDDIAVHYYIQFFLDKQLKDASIYAREHGVVLKGDIPIGIYRYSVDAWVEPELFNMNGQSGAPPDEFAISGQNWGFPTYDWNQMALDGFKWWKNRMVKMSEYFDVFRIDHILGFFRIWEIAWEHVEGIMGQFNPSIPVHQNEFASWGLHFDYERFCKPYIREHMIREIFGEHADRVFHDFLDAHDHGVFSMKEAFNSQRKIKEYFDSLDTVDEQEGQLNFWLKNSLYRLLSDVLFLETSPDAYSPRIAFHSTYSYRELSDDQKQSLDRLYNHYFYKRHNDFWRESAMQKLPVLKDATDMLICGEDLGMVPDSVPGVMSELQILSLAVQRMPNDDREFWHPADTPYLSVTTTGSHDSSTLREWWQEDRTKTQTFFNVILGEHGEAPFYCEPWIVGDIIRQHMHSPSMLAIFPLQDLIAMDGKLRREVPEEERINVPANPQHYWKYRFHIDLESLLKEEGFNATLREFIDVSGRNADY